MSSDKDDDLTDITQLPDFDEVEDDNSFASLDDLAKDIGLETTDNPPDLPGPPSVDSLPGLDEFDESSDSPPDFDSTMTGISNEDETNFGEDENSNFGEDENSSFGEDENSSFGEDENSSFGEDENSSFGDDENSSFGDDESSFGDDETNFGDDETNFGDDESSFGDDESSFGEDETNFGDDETNFGEDETNFGEDESELDQENEAKFGDDDSSFGDDDSSFGEKESNFGEDTDSSSGDEEETNFGENNSNLEDETSSSKTPERNYESIESNLKSETSTTLTPLDELTPQPEIKSVKKTPVESLTKTHTTPPEQFEEFKNFAKTMTFSNFSSEGNPPFSIILKNISFVEDVEEITSILVELKVVTEEDQENTKEMLSRGQLLIPRLSEYAAIYLSHRLRRFDVEILMGLTEEISPPKSYTSNDRGPTSKRTIYANKKHNFTFDKTTQFQDVLTTTLPQITDYQIIKYLGILTEARKLTADELKSTSIEDEIIEQAEDNTKDELYISQIKRENMLASESQNKFNYVDFYHKHPSSKKDFSLDQVYQELVSKMKAKAKDSKANGLVGINFSINPISTEEYLRSGPEYQILCTGNMVWIEKS